MAGRSREVLGECGETADYIGFCPRTPLWGAEPSRSGCLKYWTFDLRLTTLGAPLSGFFRALRGRWTNTRVNDFAHFCLTYFTARADWQQIPLPNRVTGSCVIAPLRREWTRFEPPSDGGTQTQDEPWCTGLAKQAMDTTAETFRWYRSAQQRQARPVPR
ncbi:conserved protein of unknown function [Ectopseudomonas oleovorans]|uniref:Uncharacterized protein n=1 Tax=Ectopseudomonas oleovorans TaxID=301 RepID=A0A653B878_ECTOL|nr:conserved protein of unknown function [Pseudomonas oleovorans]